MIFVFNMITGLTKLYQWTRGSKTVAVQNLTPFDPASYIFLDFETTGLIPSGLIPYITSLKGKNPGKTLEDLLKLNVDSVSNHVKNMPHITELSLRSIPKRLFEKGMNEINNGDLKFISTNDLSFQFNLPFNENEWCQYNYKVGTIPAFYLTQEVLTSKNHFHQEWNVIYHFLQNVAKPAVIIAHNGICFDYPILFGQLTRDSAGNKTNILEQFRSIEGLYFADSLEAIDGIEGTFLSEITRMITTTKSKDATLDKMSQELVNIYLNEVKSKSLTQRYPSCFVESPEQNYLLPPYKPPKQKVNQKLLYDTIIGGHFDAHRASADTEAIIKICMAYGKDFVKYVDNNCYKFPF